MTELNNQAEVVVLDEAEDEPIPYRYSITSYGADYPVDSLVKRLDQEVIFIPPFQRSYVWPLTKASRFVESLLLGLPVPGIFLSREPDTGKLLIIDGQQRLKTLQFFYTGIFQGREFRLSGVQNQLDGRTYRTLEEQDRRRLDDSIIHATVVKQDEPSDDQSSIFHIFERLNTGGMPLQPQEIRTCIFHGPFSDLLRDLNQEQAWRHIYGPASARLKDQELILRFFALYFDADRYQRPIKEFLNRYMAGNRHLRRQGGEELERTFSTSINMIRRTVGDKAFRPERALNAAVFDAVMVGMARRLSRGDITDEAAVARTYRDLLQQPDFESAFKTGTSDEGNVKTRIERATEAFTDLL